MSKYYIYTQPMSDSFMACCYDAYTDNPYIMREYVRQMDEYLKNGGYIGPVYRDGLFEIEAENEDSLFNLLMRMKIGFPMSSGNKLWSIDDGITQVPIITNELIYDRFIEELIISNGIKRIGFNLYRVSRPEILTYVQKYMRDDISEKLLRVFKIIYDTYELIRKTDETYTLISSNRLESELWNIINEGVELSRFMSVDISKILTISSFNFK